MKVLHICTSDSGGAGLCCLRIHQSLLEQGIDSKVLTLRKTRNTPGIYQYGRVRDIIGKIPTKIFQYLRLNVTDRNKIHSLSKKYNTAYTLPVSSVDITKHELIEWADIIHLHWVNNYVDYPSFFQKIKKPIVWTLHDEGLFYGIAHHHKSILVGNPLEIKYCKIKKKAVQSAYNLNIVFLSQMMYNNFGEEEIIASRKRTVINNSVNGASFFIKDRREMRKKYGFEENKIIFSFMAHDITDPNKGLEVLSQALIEMNLSNVEVLAIGNNTLGKNIPFVHCIGKVSDSTVLSEILSATDYFILPSFQEAFPQSPMEAMCCGIPVVAFPVSGMNELITTENGVVCKDFTEDSLIEGIYTAMSRRYNAETIRNDVIKRFSPEIIAQQYMYFYKNILRGDESL